MKSTLETRLGMFVALVVVAAFFILFVLGGTDRFQRGVRLHALFDTAHELKVGDRVKMAGVEIGKVEAITLATNKVRVTMRVRADAGVKTDSLATIKFAGLMGQNFVSLDFGSPAAPLAENDTLLSTTEQPDLSAIMQKLDNVATGVENLTKSFTGDRIDNLFGPITDFLKQNSGPLTATIANLRSISGQIAEGQGTVGKLIFDETLYNSALQTVTNLQSVGEEVRATVTDARRVIEGINAGQGTVGRLVKDEKLYNETAEAMTNLREILQKINQGQGTVGRLVNDPEFYKNAKLTLQKLDKATEGLEDQGPLSILGTLANGLF
ncbi:MAG: MlaD family protein [Verrucomicrobiae bacterium]|nr:MlaD family protein [Verrucomicrobiae bacterium]MDW8309125.1 MlaD family protein [Verrucomicrobiales bacterium]